MLASPANLGQPEHTFFSSLATVEDDSVLIVGPTWGTRLGTLAHEFDLSLSLLRSVWRILAMYVQTRSHLSLSVERMVDPDIGRPIEVVLEVRGTRSTDETNATWEDIDAALNEEISDADREELSRIGIHVHRGAA